MDPGAAPGTPFTVDPIIEWARTDVAMLEEHHDPTTIVDDPCLDGRATHRENQRQPSPFGRVVARRNLSPLMEDILLRIGVEATPWQLLDSADCLPPDMRQYRFIGSDGVIATMPFLPTAEVAVGSSLPEAEP